VHRLTGKARSTIAKLSFTQDDEGNRLIEASELVRGYGTQLDLDSDGGLKTKTERIEKKSQPPEENSQLLQESLERERQERERERRQYQETIGHLRDDLEKSHERESRATLLLENQSSSTQSWQ